MRSIAFSVAALASLLAPALWSANLWAQDGGVAGDANQAVHLERFDPSPSAIAIPAHDTGGQVVPSGQEGEPVAGNEVAVTEDQVTTEISALQLAIESAADLTEEVRLECVGRLDKAKGWLKKSRQHITERETAEKEVATVPSRTEAAREQLAGAVELTNPEVPPGATVALLESRLDEMRQQVKAAEEEETARQKATESRSARLSQLSKLIQETEQRVAEAREALAGATGDELPVRSIRIEQQARLFALQSQIPALKAQRALLEASGELMPLQRDLAVRTASAAKKHLQRWEEAVSNWRKDESKRQAEQARQIVETSHPALRAIAVRNAEIAERRILSANGIERVVKMRAEINESSTWLNERFENLRGKIEYAGATTSNGILLRKHRSELPSPRSFAKRAELVEAEMPLAHLHLIELKQLRREVADLDEAVANVMNIVGSALQKYDPAEVQGIVRQLLSNRSQLLDKASPDQDTYLQELNELDLANKKFEQQVREMREFLDQRVLWMRSHEPLNAQNISQAFTGLGILLRPSGWIEVVQVCVGDLIQRPAAGILAVTVIVLVIMFRANLLAKQRRLCAIPTGGEKIRFSHYLAGFALTFVVSVRWPLLLAAIGYRAQIAAHATTWTQAVGAALFTTVLFVWSLELIGEFSRRDGIGERLFGWSANVTVSLRGLVDTAMLVGAPLFAILQLTQWQESPEMENLQRVTFIAILLLVGFQIAWLVRPKGKLMVTLAEQSPDALVYRLRKPVWFFSSAAPLAFAVMSVVGYHFSAYQLSGRLAESAVAIVAVIVSYSLALSWLKVKAYNREVEQLRRDMEQHQSNGQATVTIEKGASDEEDPVEVQAIRAMASRETRDLLRYAAMIGLVCGGWFIWSDVLPALRVFDQVTLWQNLQTVSETIVDPDGVESITTFEKSVPTTLTNLIVAIAIGMLTVLVSRRLPSLLELTLLDRLPLDHGGRQAIAILARYAATLTGMMFICHAVKISWESVQWLAAAMTVGLGFGLQEIFANLVSGLIILFERPIRAGDLVTVDDVTGNVTRMQIRATTITDFDRREFIVPNKRFITDNVINWTLSDPISRVVFPVGVAYGTDVNLVHEILLRIAKYERIVMNEPKPVTVFKGFGDSTLDFELRLFIPQREMVVDVTNRINGAIAEEFHKAEIEIAFPQLDLHVKGAALQPAVSLPGPAATVPDAADPTAAPSREAEPKSPTMQADRRPCATRPRRHQPQRAA